MIRFFSTVLAIGLICYALYSCVEVLSAPRNYIYYGEPTL